MTLALARPWINDVGTTDDDGAMSAFAAPSYVTATRK
ncbi:MAG: hypothetical protein QOE41_1472 [Mycobacterium sp.]|jgi:hypothetical protein|nr:hypothetical protein [Mycobacterium sp.]MDT5132161.1 hypothetical protein [Mycobacterium sp.]